MTSLQNCYSSYITVAVKNAKQSSELKLFHLTDIIYLRPQLVKSLVIVIRMHVVKVYHNYASTLL